MSKFINEINGIHELIIENSKLANQLSTAYRSIIDLIDEIENYKHEIDMLNHRIVELERELS